MSDQIPQQLLDSATELFLEKDFYSVSIRELAAKAGTSSGMIKYYFNNKQGLFEAMLTREYGRILQVLKDVIAQDSLLDFSETMNRVMSLYEANPNMPRFIIKTYLLRQGPGSALLKQWFEQEKRMVDQWVVQVIKEGKIDRDTNAEVVRIAFMALTLLPGLMIDNLKESYSDNGYQQFRQDYVQYAGEMLLNSVKPRSRRHSSIEHKSKTRD